MINLLKRLAAGEEGTTLVEYALLVSLVGAAVVTFVTTLGTSIGAQFASVSNTIAGP